MSHLGKRESQPSLKVLENVSLELETRMVDLLKIDVEELKDTPQTLVSHTEQCKAVYRELSDVLLKITKMKIASGNFSEANTIRNKRNEFKSDVREFVNLSNGFLTDECNQISFNTSSLSQINETDLESNKTVVEFAERPLRASSPLNSLVQSSIGNEPRGAEGVGLLRATPRSLNHTATPFISRNNNEFDVFPPPKVKSYTLEPTARNSTHEVKNQANVPIYSQPISTPSTVLSSAPNIPGTHTVGSSNSTPFDFRWCSVWSRWSQFRI